MRLPSKIKLIEVIKRRKLTLKMFINEFGITTYNQLLDKCDDLGVQPPTLEEYNVAMPSHVTDINEGIIVLESPKIINDLGNDYSEISVTMPKRKRAKIIKDLDD